MVFVLIFAVVFVLVLNAKLDEAAKSEHEVVYQQFADQVNSQQLDEMHQALRRRIEKFR